MAATDRIEALQEEVNALWRTLQVFAVPVIALMPAGKLSVSVAEVADDPSTSPAQAGHMHSFALCLAEIEAELRKWAT